MDAFSSAWNYASSSINSLMGGEGELAVVDPSSKEAGTSKLQDSQDEKRQAAFASYRDYIGMDITSLVQLPLFIMEPYTMLQKVAEIMEYTELLDRAAATADPYERLAWVAGFCLGPFGSNERTWKPFNPILGETFEVDRPNGVRFLAEQVSHHPPIAAAHAENRLWTYDIVSAPTTRFLGNSVEIFPVGRSRISLRETGEVFSLVPPNSKAHNVIMGRTWVDCYGDLSLVNASTGAVCSLYFTPCGWFSYGRYEVLGHISTPEGKKVLKLWGLWNSRLDMVPCDEAGEALPDATPTNLWMCKEKPEGDKYGFTHFALENCSGKGMDPLPSDSRRRGDRHALQEGDTGRAGHVKQALEDQQRAEKKARVEAGREWSPRWFRPAADKTIYPGEATEEECPMWDFTGSYLSQHAHTTSEGDSTGLGFNPFEGSTAKP